MNPANTVRARSYPRFLYVVYYIIIGLVRLVTRLLLAVRVTGGADFPRTGPVLIAANHLSYFDIPFLLIFLPRPPIFVAKQEVTTFPLVGRLLHRLGTVSIRRGQSDRRAIRHSLAVLENDDVLLIFPEGTRSRRPGLLAGLPGSGVTGTSRRGPAGDCGDHRYGEAHPAVVLPLRPHADHRLAGDIGGTNPERPASHRRRDYGGADAAAGGAHAAAVSRPLRRRGARSG